MRGFRAAVMESALESYFNTIILKICTFAGIVQGVAWSVLSFIAIVWHISAKYDQKITYQDSYHRLLNTYLYYTFIKNNGPNTNMYVQPGGFCGVMASYFLVSLAWLSISLYAYAGYRKNFGVSKMTIIWILWAIVATANLLLDLIFCSFLAADYNSVLNHYNDTSEMVRKLAYTYSTIGYGLVMILAARGFVLWFINLTLIIIVIKICIELKSDPPSQAHDEGLTPEVSRRFTVPVRNLPDEARNPQVDITPRRRQTEPVSPGLTFESTSDVNADNRNVLYTFDPEVERRLSKYVMTPNQIKNRFRF